jgi:peptidoglycan/xylan/chitin deacetylase (PgdA/CDA1 family)
MRRRTIAAALALSFVVILGNLATGDGGGLGKQEAKIAGASPAKLPWRQPVGPAGPVDPGGHPTLSAQRAAVAHYIRLGKPIFCTPGSGRYAALTFDDGPTDLSNQFIDRMKGAGFHATFFLVGQNAAEKQDAVRRQDREAGGVADHTWTHADLTKLSAADRNSELTRTQNVLQQTIGQPITLFRPPYGATNRAVASAVKKLGMLEILWSVDSRDALGADQGSITATVTDGLNPGAIMLMHELFDRSLASLPAILTDAKKKQIKLVSIPELLTLDPPSDAMVRAGGNACGETEKYRNDPGTAMRLAGQPVVS